MKNPEMKGKLTNRDWKKHSEKLYFPEGLLSVTSIMVLTPHYMNTNYWIRVPTLGDSGDF